MHVEFVTVEKSELARMIETAVKRAITDALKPPDEVMDKRQLMAYLKKSEPTINRWMLKGLPHHGPGRPIFKRSEVDMWIKEN